MTPLPKRNLEWMLKMKSSYNFLLSHTFLGTTRISCTFVILTVQQILLTRSISSKEHHLFLMDFI